MIPLDIVVVITNQKYNKIVIDTIDYRNEKALSTDDEKAIKVHEGLKVSHTLTQSTIYKSDSLVQTPDTAQHSHSWQTAAQPKTTFFNIKLMI